jgi:hypothetical protein
LFGIREDLNLKGTQYSTLSSIFYVGWLIWALPGNLLMAKFPLSKYLGINVNSQRIVQVGGLIADLPLGRVSDCSRRLKGLQGYADPPYHFWCF